MISWGGEQVAVADAGEKAHRVALQLRLELLDERAGHGGLDGPRGVVHHAPARDVDEIASKGGVVSAEDNPHAGGLDGSPPRVVGGGIVAEERHVGHVASRGQAFGNGLHPADAPRHRERVHVGRRCVLERSFPTERLLGLVGHAVTDEDGVFHFRLQLDFSSLSFWPLTFRYLTCGLCRALRNSNVRALGLRGAPR